MRLHYYCPPDNAKELESLGCPQETEGGYSLTTVKQYLKQFGGHGYTCHIERDGGVFDTTEIKIKGNNSRFKYNHHL